MSDVTRDFPHTHDHPAHILIVDDDQKNRRLLELMLTQANYRLACAASGAAAFAQIEKQLPDLIVLDVMMPVMDGNEVAIRLKLNPGTKNIPIIMVTALSDHDARMVALRAGAADFLTKPVDQAELCVRVRNLLRMKAYGDYYDRYSQMLERDVISRTAELQERTALLENQTAVLLQQAELLELARDAIVVRDMEGRIISWSRGAEALYGWGSVEAVGQDVFALLDTSLFESRESADATLRLEGQWEGEAIHHARDGTRAIVATRWSLQRDADGEPFRVLSIDNDITERKAAEGALEQSGKERMRFKDDFLSNVSHELRSPLSAIKQFTSILFSGIAGELTPVQRDYQQIVLKNVQQLQSMIDDLLEVTRLESGKLTVNQESTSIRDAIADALDTLNGAARAKGVNISSDVPADLPASFADRTRLRQMLIILLDNAIKFTTKGGSALVRASLLSTDARFLLVEVLDDGCGISADRVERLFDRLYQVPATTTASRKGLGLGLFICKELSALQGGKIWVEARPQRGSIFAFTIPVFSLYSVMAPLLVNEGWPSPRTSLVTITLELPCATPPLELQKEWSREGRSLLDHCLLPDLDVLLPHTQSDGVVAQFFVATFADDAGTMVLANLIRSQFERDGRLDDSGITVTVAHSALPAREEAAGRSTETLISTMVSAIETAIESHLVPHE